MANQIDVLEYLVRLKFPFSRAPAPINSGPETSELWGQTVAKIEAYRAELWQMSEADRAALYDASVAHARETDRLQRERGTPPMIEPDAAYWIRQHEWRLSAAALLLTNLEPRSGLGYLLQQSLLAVDVRLPNDAVAIHRLGHEQKLSDGAQVALGLADEIYRNALSAANRQGLQIAPNATVDPSRFLVWARDRQYEIPGGLAPLLVDTPSRDQLQDENLRLRAELSQAVTHVQTPSPPRRLSENAKAMGTALKFVAYFARKFEHDPQGKKNDSTSKTIAVLQGQGLSMDAKTVREWLDRAVEKHPPE